MARKIYSHLVGIVDGEFEHPVITDNEDVNAVIHLGDTEDRAWFSFDEDSATVNDGQDAKYGVTVYDAGDADTAAVQYKLSYVNQQVAMRKDAVTSVHDNFDLFEAIINSDTDITDLFASTRTAIAAELTELGF